MCVCVCVHVQVFMKKQLSIIWITRHSQFKIQKLATTHTHTNTYTNTHTQTHTHTNAYSPIHTHTHTHTYTHTHTHTRTEPSQVHEDTCGHGGQVARPLQHETATGQLQRIPSMVCFHDNDHVTLTKHTYRHQPLTAPSTTATPATTPNTTTY